MNLHLRLSSGQPPFQHNHARYDGNNLRVKKVSGSTTTVYVFSGSKVVAEYVNGAAPASPTREYIYSGSALIAKIESGATKYYHQDHLSNRLVTDSSGNLVAQMGHYPFGESWYNASSDKLLFTTYERDSESGNDFAQARYYIFRFGRFASPDSVSGSTGDPQSLNRYPYTQNNPINATDPSGAVKIICEEDWMCPGQGGGGGDPGDQFCFLPGCNDPPPRDDTPPWHTPATMGEGKDAGGALYRAILASRRQPPPPPGYEQCIMEPLQEVIAAGEVPNEPNSGYYTLVHGKVWSAPEPFNIFVGQRNLTQLDPNWITGHPGIQVLWKKGHKTSSAFGRYQITIGTANAFGFTDFSPRGQDAAAEVLMQGLNMVTPAMQGNLALAMSRGKDTWASLPGANAADQHSMSMQQAQSVFNDALNTLPDCQ